MKKALIYFYAFTLMIPLIVIGNLGDDLLFTIIHFFNLTGMTNLKLYVIIVALLLILVSTSLIIGLKSPLPKKTYIRILVGGILGATGWIWLLSALLARDL